jgi:alcohol dehydrogenase
MLNQLERNIVFYNPRRLIFGSNGLKQMAEDYLTLGLTRLFIITVPALDRPLSPALSLLASGGVTVKLYQELSAEPSFRDFDAIMAEARNFGADSIAGIGGGSVMDVAKVVAALLRSTQTIQSIVGNGLLKERQTYLICMPSTSGTGSEVSPNAILIDESDGSKKGIISPFLVPDAAYVDPALTVGLPPLATAFTGIDALTHCIEAYTNKFAHPMTDVLALEGIKLIAHYLKRAVDNGHDLEARSKVALGSVYGGMCLGPVNTAAVHALAYPLGTQFKIAHGLSNALLLTYVMEFNLYVEKKKYADIALAIGASEGSSVHETALNGISMLQQLINNCGIPSHLSSLGIPETAIDKLGRLAMEVQRLLKNNIREVTLEDAVKIYKTAY